MSFIRASEELSRTIILPFPWGKWDNSFLCEPTRRCPVPPRRPAMCRPPPSRLWFLRVLDSANTLGKTIPVVAESQTQTYHERGRAGQGTSRRRGGAGRGGAGPGIENNCPRFCFGSTVKGNPSKPNQWTQRVADERLVSGLSAGPRPLFVPGAGRRFFVSVSSIHAKHNREYIIVIRIPGNTLLEKGLQRQTGDGPTGQQPGRGALMVPLVNRSLCVPRSGLNGISLVRASEKTSRGAT